ncbi:MAG TPA: thioredoxin domain-containing protein [Candidatus Dormibacteraeota bacterium]|nr:thioredoxin domain-containing protein [Candidatus Dormibacteraeota bacterium]
MASRTKQKEEARARRLAEEQARAQRASRQRRMRMLLGIIAGAAAIVAVVVAISIGHSSSTGLQTGTKAAQTVASVEKLFNGIPQSGATLGNPKAPVTLTYYGDLECPVCRDFTLTSFPELVSKDVRDGKVKVVYKAFQTATPSQSAFNTQQAAALAAGEQNRFWNFVDLFYRQQGQEGTGYANQNFLTGLAHQVPGLSVSEWNTARNNAALTSQVQTEQQTGASQGVQATPTLIFQGPKGKTTPSAAVPTYSQLQTSINSVQ